MNKSKWNGILELPLIKKFLNKETILYVIVGVLTTVVDYVVFALVNELLKAGGTDVTTSSSIATAAAWLGAVIFAYFTNKIFVFESRDWRAKALLREILKFFGARVLSGLITLLLMRLTVGAGMNEYLAKILTSVFNLVFNYVASKLLIFKKENPPADLRKDFEARQKARVRNMYLIAFFVPVIIVTLIYLSSEVWPLGSECFMKTDMYHQYVPFMSEFRHKLTAGGSLTYSWDIGLGVNFAAIYAYYLASPFNWLVILVPEGYEIEFMNVLMILKLGLASLSFTWYLHRKALDRRDMGPALFGIVYALSGYLCAYYWNTMWLDCIVLFPLIVGTLELLIQKGRIFPYALALGVCITSNYYISIMICVFLVLYFVAMNVLEQPADVKTFLVRCGKFAAGSLTAGAMACVLVLPAYYALQLAASGSSTFPKTVKAYFSVVEMLARLQPAVTTEQGLEHWPNIYSGTFVFILFPLYLMAKKIPVREKAVYCVLALFLLASFSINVLDYTWHGFHFPNSLPCRQSFTFVLVLLTMCYRAYERKLRYHTRELGIALVSAAVFLLYAQKGADTKYYPFYVTWISLGLCGIYTLLLWMISHRKASRLWIYMTALLFVSTEVTVNAAVTSFTTCSRSYYISDNADVKRLAAEVLPAADEEEAAEKKAAGNDSAAALEIGFWRFDRGTRRTKNDGAWLHFPTVSLFSSTADASVTKTLTKLGCEASTNAYSNVGSTPLADMLLGVRYVFADKDLAAEEGAETYGKRLVDESGDVRLYENTNVLPVGYVLPKALAQGNAFNGDNPVQVQNKICDACGVARVLTEELRSGTANGKTYTVYTSEAGEYYAWVTNTGVKSATVSIDGNSKDYNNLDRKYLLKLGQLQENELITFTSKTEGQDMKVELYRVEFDALEELGQKLASQQVTVLSHSDTCLRAEITVDPAAYGYKDGTARLFFSIPYDEGWTAKVDGVSQATVEGFNDTFLCLDLPAGTHTVELNYTPKGLKAGLLVTVLGYLALAGLFLWDKKTRAAEVYSDFGAR